MSPLGQRTRRVDPSRFSMVPRSDVPRSVFRTQSTYKTTLNAGLIVPVYVDEVLPGDSFTIRATGFARMSTPLFPVMDNMFLDWFWFYVPYRLVWDNFKRFMGETNTPGESVDYLIPEIDSPVGGYAIGSLQDYMGLPTVGQVDAVQTVGGLSVLPLRAYNLIFHEWFRDENLVAATFTSLFRGDGPDDGTGGKPSNADYILRKRGKRHDYFTSCLPWPEKPIAPLDAFTSGVSRLITRPERGAPVSGLGVESPVTAAQVTNQAVHETGRQPDTVVYPVSVDVNALTAGDRLFLRLVDSAGYPDIRVTVKAIREAYMIQRLMELDARGGTRYTEIVRAHFGVVSPDARLQRPEYLGGGSQAVNIHPVAQTSATAGAAALGDLAAAGTSIGGSGFSGSFTEHGVILGLVSIRADLTYQQGVRRFWWRRTKYDFYWPTLAHLGEQAVLSKEIWCDGVGGQGTDDSVFGYQERWAEYKHVPSMITGRFRSTAALTLDGWHLSQRFLTRPVLDETFMNETPPMSRVLAEGQSATDNSQEFLLDALYDITMVRPIPAFSVPGLGGRF